MHTVLSCLRTKTLPIFHLIFVSNRPIPEDWDLGIAGDIFVHSEGIAWHTGRSWSNWAVLLERPRHPFVPGLKMVFNTRTISISWSPDDMVAKYQRYFWKGVHGYLEYRREQRVTSSWHDLWTIFLHFERAEMTMLRLTSIVRFMLTLYAETLPPAPDLLPEDYIPAHILEQWANA